MSDSFTTLWAIHSMGFSRPEYWSGQLFPSPGGLPNPGIKPRSPVLQADSLPAEPPGKPVNTGVGSLSLLQGIFPTQGSNPGLPYCRQILYQFVTRAYVPRLFVLSQQRFGVTDIKAPSACHSSQVLDRPCYSSQVSKGPCYSS